MTCAAYKSKCTFDGTLPGTETFRPALCSVQGSDERSSAVVLAVAALASRTTEHTVRAIKGGNIARAVLLLLLDERAVV